MLDRFESQRGARRRKRVGRGPGSGIGRYCGRGVKGQGTRSGSGNAPLHFEGGQMPLARRLPKRGFTNIFRKAVEIVNLSDLADLGQQVEVNPEILLERRIIRNGGRPVKILGNGEAPSGLQVKVHRVSASARKKIEAAGGSIELLNETRLRG